jgi:acyl-CoA hydrolase
VWGAPRRSPIAVAGASRPAGPPPDELAPFPFVEGVTPTFTRNFEYRWIGPVPFSGARVPEVSGWIRHRAISRVDAGAVLAMLDAWPLPVLSLLRAPAAASTVTWMVDLVGPIAPDPAGWWRYASSTEQAGDGYVDMRARLWGPDGVLVATSSQLGAEFAPVEAP